MISPIRLILRAWKPGDAAALAAFAGSGEVDRHLHDAFPQPYAEENARAFIEKVSGEEPTKHFAILADDLLIGSVAVRLGEGAYEKTARLQVWLAEAHQGRGLGTKAISQTTYYAFITWNLVRVEVRCFGDNVATQKALLNAGFHQEARLEKAVFKNGRLYDEYVFAIINPELEIAMHGRQGVVMEPGDLRHHSPEPNARL